MYICMELNILYENPVAIFSRHGVKMVTSGSVLETFVTFVKREGMGSGSRGVQGGRVMREDNS